MKSLSSVLILLFLFSVAPAIAFVESSLADYYYVSQMEMLLNNSNSALACREAIGLRRQHDLQMARVTPVYGSYSQYQRKLHDLHVQKFNVLNTYLEAWRSSERGSERTRSKAEKDKALFVLSQINEAINILLTGGGSQSSLVRVEQIERGTQKNSSNYEVTSCYLLIENHRLKRGEPIWVMEVVSGLASVMHMGSGRSSVPISGWVSIYDLEHRTNWRPDPAVFHAPSPPYQGYITRSQPRTKLVIVTEMPYLRRDRYISRRHYGENRSMSHRSHDSNRSHISRRRGGKRRIDVQDRQHARHSQRGPRRN